MGCPKGLFDDECMEVIRCCAIKHAKIARITMSEAMSDAGLAAVRLSLMFNPDKCEKLAIYLGLYLNSWAGKERKYWDSVGRTRSRMKVEVGVGNHRQRKQGDSGTSAWEDEVPAREHYTPDLDFWRYAMRGLNKRERVLLILRHFEDMSRPEIGKHLGVSRQRVEQIEDRINVTVQGNLVRAGLFTADGRCNQ